MNKSLYYYFVCQSHRHYNNTNTVRVTVDLCIFVTKPVVPELLPSYISLLHDYLPVHYVYGTGHLLTYTRKL
jgi:hypothetical protein